MLAIDHRPDRNAADQLYCTLTRTHSPCAAALMTAAVTGKWPNDFRFPTFHYRRDCR